jgi:uncharacterized surface protein with fasciclin (FAS1) repeats
MLDRRLFLLAAATAASAPLAARAQTLQSVNPNLVPGTGTTPPQMQMADTNVVDAMARAGGFDRFIELIQRAGLTDILRGAGPFTVLAPINSAIERIPGSLLQQLDPRNTTTPGTTNNTPDLVRLPALINMHIIPGRYTLAELQGRTTAIRTRNGNTVEIAQAGTDPFRVRTVRDSGFGIGGISTELQPANFLNPEIVASNGVVLPISIPLIQ